MRQPESETTRAETVMAALLYLMTHYARTGCPKLAVCVSRHMQCLALHPEAPAVVRDVCASLHGTWGETAVGPRSNASIVH
ncbi:MAG: hypothetical protein AB7S87_14410 [Burkholderiales bacterium]